ncbi:unnamed protein product [Pedinophyceae sp. YPF-701]|nr:unnamed protein product [Pedinophyceae sp. YPF-701]
MFIRTFIVTLLAALVATAQAGGGGYKKKSMPYLSTVANVKTNGYSDHGTITDLSVTNSYVKDMTAGTTQGNSVYGSHVSAGTKGESGVTVGKKGAGLIAKGSSWFGGRDGDGVAYGTGYTDYKGKAGSDYLFEKTVDGYGKKTDFAGSGKGLSTTAYRKPPKWVRPKLPPGVKRQPPKKYGKKGGNS